MDIATQALYVAGPLMAWLSAGLLTLKHIRLHWVHGRLSAGDYLMLTLCTLAWPSAWGAIAVIRLSRWIEGRKRRA